MAPQFLQRLELDTSADERAIRRAYAQKLKQIDQEADPAGFQALRAAYDAALNWARHAARAASAGPVSATPVGSAAETPVSAAAAQPVPSYAQRNIVPRVRVAAASSAEPQHVASPLAEPVSVPVKRAPVDDPVAHAAAALSGFLDAFRSALADTQSALDRKVWQAKLEQALASDALVNMAARDVFEQRLALLLTRGWQPGHEVLLTAATHVFRWDEGRGGLRRLGQAGLVLDRAMQERATFDLQFPHERVAQRDVIQRLRDPAEPTADELVSSMPRLEAAAGNFPNWLGMITDLSRLPQWRELYAALPALGRAAPKSAARPRAAARSGSSRRWWGGAVVALAVVLINMAHLSSPKYSPMPTTGFEQQSRNEGNTRSAPALPPPARTQWQPPQPQFRWQSPQLPQPPNTAPIDSAATQPMPPPSKAAIAALVRRAPGPDVCSEVYRMTQVYDVGTAMQKSDLGPRFDRQIVACVARHNWPVASYNDPAVDQALRREKARVASAWKKLGDYRLLADPQPRFTMPKPVAPMFSLPAADAAR